MDTLDYLLFLFNILVFALGLLCGYFLARRQTKTIGDIEIYDDGRGVKRFSLVLDSDPDDIDNYKRVTFNIKPDQSSS